MTVARTSEARAISVRGKLINVRGKPINGTVRNVHVVSVPRHRSWKLSLTMREIYGPRWHWGRWIYE